MDLLERYLQAVRFFLPRSQDDIVRELEESCGARWKTVKASSGAR
jgi:hypothetical protein